MLCKKMFCLLNSVVAADFNGKNGCGFQLFVYLYALKYVTDVFLSNKFRPVGGNSACFQAIKIFIINN